MIQQFIALILIALLVVRLIRQKNQAKISPSEFYLWLIFWILAGGAIALIKHIDRLVAYLGFSGSGINVLLYLAVIILFYLIFRLRLSLARLDQDITTLNRQITLDRVQTPADNQANTRETPPSK